MFNNGAWQAKDPKHFSSKYFIFYDLIVRLRLFLPFQSFFLHVIHHLLCLFYDFPLPVLDMTRTWPKVSPFIWQLCTDITFTWTVIFPVLISLKATP